MNSKMKGGRCPCQRGGDGSNGEIPDWLNEAINETKEAVNSPKALSATSPEVGSFFKGGYKATARNRKYLRKYRQGKSIGFTMKASLKAKGLLPRTSRTMKGKRVLGAKYK